MSSARCGMKVGVAANCSELEARYRSDLGDPVDRRRMNLNDRPNQQGSPRAHHPFHNNVLGYFIEVTSRHADKMGGPFIHRQTMTNAMRFTTTELGELACGQSGGNIGSR